MSERVAICERIVRHDDRESLCLRLSGHRGSCIGLRKHAAEADAFQRGVEAMRFAAADAAHGYIQGYDCAKDIGGGLRRFIDEMPSPKDKP